MDLFSLKILALYSSRKSLTLTQLGAILNQSPVDLVQYVLRLLDKSLLSIEPIYAKMHEPAPEGTIEIDIPLVLTIDGRNLLETETRKEKERRDTKKHLIINTVIAGLALIVSILSVILQYL